MHTGFKAEICALIGGADSTSKVFCERDYTSQPLASLEVIGGQLSSTEHLASLDVICEPDSTS